MSQYNLYSGAQVAGESIEPDRFVTISGGDVIAADAATDNPIGVNLHAVVSGEKPSIAGPGSVVVVDIKAGETISAANTPLTCDTGGKVTASIVDTNYVVAVSEAAGSGTGGKIRVRVVEPYTLSV